VFFSFETNKDKKVLQFLFVSSYVKFLVSSLLTFITTSRRRRTPDCLIEETNFFLHWTYFIEKRSTLTLKPLICIYLIRKCRAFVIRWEKLQHLRLIWFEKLILKWLISRFVEVLFHFTLFYSSRLSIERLLHPPP